MHSQAMEQEQVKADARKKEQAIRIAKLAGVADPERRVEPELTATLRFGDPNLAALYQEQARIELIEEALAKLESSSSVDSPRTSLKEVDGIGPDLAEKLEEAGYQTPEDLKSASDEELLAVDGLGQAKLRQIRADLSR